MQFELNTVQKLSQNLNQAKVLVVGDVMLDRYWFGEVNRISPEAPVPIAKITKTEIRPGGAANVARNIASLGGNVSLISVVGNDDAANDLEHILSTTGVTSFLKRDQAINTIVKLRVLAKNQQLIRLDFEQDPSHEILAEVLDDYRQMLPNFDIVIISDYAKGGLIHTIKMIELAKKLNIPVLVDPKGSDYSRYANATIITPNKAELQSVIGMWADEKDLCVKTTTLKQKLNLESLLLTRSEDGMTLFTQDKAINYPTITQEVYDVSGAGDTVIATLGLMLANNIPLEQAVSIANIAAGIVVGKLGTATLDKDELLAKLSHYIPTN